MREAIRPVADSYDVIVIDCPSGVGLGIESALNAADLVVVPIVPSTLPLRSFDQFAAYVAADRRLQRLRVLAFLSMVDRRKKGHRLLAEGLTRGSKPMLKTTIPMSVHIENMAALRTPLVNQSGRSAAALAYRDLWDELQRVRKRRQRS
jgi:chromosome partitioning protein